MLRSPNATVTQSKLRGGNGSRSASHCTAIEQAIAAALQHLAVHIGRPDFAFGADAARERSSEIAAAGGDVEHPLAAARPRNCHRKRLPVAVQAERHEIVHQVVALGDAVEHLADTLRLLVLGDLAKSEIDFLG